MKIKKEFIILPVLIIAICIYLFLYNPNRANYKLPDIPNIATSKITKIEISKSDSTIVLHKDGNNWYINKEKYLADANKIDSILNIISDLTVTALVSESGNYTRYELDDKKKIKVKAWTNKTLKRTFEVGKTAISYEHTFIRLDKDKRVYHAKGDLRKKLNQSLDDFRDKSVLSFQRDRIDSIEITKGDNKVYLVRKEVSLKENEKKGSEKPETKIVWKTADGREGNKSKIERLISRLHDLKCKEYIYGRKIDDLKDPVYSIRLKGAEEYNLSVFAKTSKIARSSPAVSSGNRYPFLLSDIQLEDIIIEPDGYVNAAQ